MPQLEPFVRVRTWGLKASSDLEASIASASSKLSPYRAQIEQCEVQVGRWSLHHDQGYMYRVTVVIDRKGGGAALTLEAETDVNPQASARDAILASVFSRAVSRLAAS